MGNGSSCRSGLWHERATWNAQRATIFHPRSLWFLFASRLGFLEDAARPGEDIMKNSTKTLTDSEALKSLTRREYLFVEYLSLTDLIEEASEKAYLITCEIQGINQEFQAAIDKGRLSEKVLRVIRYALRVEDPPAPSKAKKKAVKKSAKKTRKKRSGK
jgi:hypothetical protein